MNHALAFACAMGVGLAAPTIAKADPCRAVSDEGWRPAAVAPGKTFSGPVVHVIDGDSLCVAIGEGQGAWVEVRLADFHAPELQSGGERARSALERMTAGQQATCVSGPGSYDRIVAHCRIGGKPLGDQLRAAGVKEGGNGADDEANSTSRRASFTEPRPVPAPRSATAYGMSCPELRARGGARRGEPGYRVEWDGDRDGVACEAYRRR